MPLGIHPASPSDAPALASIFLSAFSDPFNKTLFPPTDDVREWWVSKLTDDCIKPGSGDILLKAVDRTAAGDEVVAAFAIWNLPPADPHAVNPVHQDVPLWPRSSHSALCDWFFGRMEEKRVAIVGGRRHYYLDMLGTRPDYHGRGLGSMLLQWGLDRADRDGLEVYLSASPAGRPLYEKRGFQVVEIEEVFPDSQQAYMLRPKSESWGKQ